jgi:glycosyltransferase involved in cell wall biosynthesis
MERQRSTTVVLLDHRMGAGGVGRYGRLLARGLHDLDRGPAVAVAVVRRGSTGTRRALTAPYTPWGRAWVAGAAARCAVDVVHNLSFETPPTRRPVVVTVNDVIPLEHPRSMPNAARRVAFRRIVRTTLRRAAAIVVPSARTASALLEHVGPPAGQLLVVPHAVDPAFRPASATARAAARHRFARGGRYVAVVGGARPHKNLDAVVSIAADLTRGCGVEVVLRGPPVRSRWVRTVGPLSDPDLRSLYAGAEVVVVPSVVEGYGYPAVEAAACGVPVVCSDALGAVEVLGGAPVITDVTDPSALTRSVVGVLADEARAQDRVRAGLVATSALTPRAMAAVTYRLYREVAG